MPLAILTTKERQTYSKIPAETDEPILLRYFILTAADERLLRSVRRDYNRIGVALQLGLLRWLGRQPGLEEFRARPATITAFLAQQLNVPADTARVYPKDAGTWVGAISMKTTARRRWIGSSNKPSATTSREASSRRR